MDVLEKMRDDGYHLAWGVYKLMVKPISFGEFLRLGLDPALLPPPVMKIMTITDDEVAIAEWMNLGGPKFAQVTSREQAIQKRAWGASSLPADYSPIYDAVVSIMRAKIATGQPVVVSTSRQSFYTITTPEGLQAYIDDPGSYAGKYN
jgi:hypothetical protein